jgi:hypothetical protein
MQVKRVVPREQFAALAIEVTDEPDVEFIDEMVRNTYGKGAYARLRGPQAIGAGYIDVSEGGEWHNAAHVNPGATGWLLLGEDRVDFYEAGSLWTEYKEYS